MIFNQLGHHMRIRCFYRSYTVDLIAMNRTGLYLYMREFRHGIGST